jgi:hypothetical protein
LGLIVDGNQGRYWSRPGKMGHLPSTPGAG